MSRAVRAFAALEPQERVAWTLVVLATVLWLVLFTLLSPWLIEDAAISLSYARHIGTGDGPVPTPGAEVVEGFSNPLWTVLLALGVAIGLSPWVLIKLAGMVGGVVGLALTWAWARRLVGPGWLSAVAPILLACNTQWTIWRAAGLENPLFDVLIAGGCLRWLVERERGGAPWSAVLLGLAAVTRPEGVATVLLVGGFVFVGRWRQSGPKGLGLVFLWFTIAIIPWVAWEVYRLQTFGWPHPNTYYAKVDAIERSLPFDWDARSWFYLTRWSLIQGVVVVLPLVLGSLVGTRGWRVWVVGVAVVVCSLLALVGIPNVESWLWSGKEPNWLELCRVISLMLTGALALSLGWGRPHDEERLLAASVGFAALAFAVWSGGDWMEGWRWMSPVAIPLCLLVADGLAAFVQTWPGRVRWWVLWASVPALAGVGYDVWFLSHVDTTPFDIGRRVIYHEAILKRVDLRFPLVLDIDQGGNQWWGEFALLDMAGLNDVAVAHHGWEKPFVEEYGYRERLPDIAHIHGSWADQTRFVHLPGWKKFLRIPPYPVSRRTSHPGTFLRRELLFGPPLDRADPHWNNFADKVGVVWQLEAAEAVPGSVLVVRGGMQRLSKATLRPFRLLVTVSSGERLVVHDVPPAWDWVPVSAFATGESVNFRVEIPIPVDFPLGPVDLTMSAFAEDGEPLRAWTQKTIDKFGRFVRAEAAWPAAGRIVDDEVAGRLSRDDLRVSARQAVQGNCEGAVRRIDAVEARSGAAAVTEEGRAEVARCYAVRAEGLVREEAQAAIVAARNWAHRDPVVIRTGRRMADGWEQAGNMALEQGNRTAAHDLWVAALAADPTRGPLRRRVEENRDVRLGIVKP